MAEKLFGGGLGVFEALTTDELATETVELLDGEKGLSPLPVYRSAKTLRGVRIYLETWAGVQVFEYSGELLEHLADRDTSQETAEGWKDG